MFRTSPRPAHGARLFSRAWLAAVGLLCLFPAPLSAQERGKSAGKDSGAVPAKLTKERFFDKIIEARGGREAIEAVHNRIYRGTIEIKSAQGTNSSPIEVWEAEGNKRYQSFQFGPSPVERGSDGTVHWEITQKQPRILSGDEKASAERTNRFNEILYWAELYPDTTIVGKETVDGQSCYKVVQKPAVGPERTLYFSRKTGLLVRLDTVRQTPQAALPVVIRYEDYREVDGVKLPFKTVQRVTAGNQEQIITTTWDAIVQNSEDATDERFALPPEVQKLVGAAPGEAPNASK